MFKNYLTVALRNLLRHKGYSLINVLGLSIGITCWILIFLYIQYEFSYDRHHEKTDHIYRILREIHMPGADPYFIGRTPGILAPALQGEFPEIEQAVRVFPRSAWTRYKKKGFNQSVCLVEPNFLDVFTLPFVRGDSETAFRNPDAILLTEDLAQKYFGSENPLGKVVTIEDRLLGGDYTVTGVLRNIPQNSHFRFDSLIIRVGSYPTLLKNWQEWHPNPNAYRRVLTYLLLREDADPVALERKLPDFLKTHLGEEIVNQVTYHVQPLTDIYLHTRNVEYDGVTYGDINTVYIFSSIAVFILLIACINFMNLATARSATRAREVGMRKVVGAHRTQLIRQLLSESTFMAFIALLIAIALVELVLPSFNAFTGKPLALNAKGNGPMLLGLLGVACLVGLLAGSYPALFLSAFRPAEVLKGTFKPGTGSSRFRNALVVFQFALSIVLIVGTLIIRSQLDYIRNRKLGFDKDQIITMNLFRQDYDLIPRYKAVKQAFLQHPNVLKASVSLSLPGIWTGITTLRVEGVAEDYRFLKIDIDEDFLDTFNLELLSGRNVPQDFSEDARVGFILNETAVKQLGWKHPIGKELEWVGMKRKVAVIGVVKDFHIDSLHEKIGPLALDKWPPFFRYLSLKIRPENIAETLASVEATWKKFLPNRPFQFRFLDKSIDNMYREEMRQNQIFQVFSLLAIFVACLGIFGLAAFTTEQRTKEIGIRKVLGASVTNLVILLSREFVKPVFIANLVAWPVVFYAMDRWLQDFAYRIDLDVLPFLLGGVLALAIAFSTVGYQAFKAARTNPVDSLRCE